MSATLYIMGGVPISEEELQRLAPHHFDREVECDLPRVGDLVTTWTITPQEPSVWGVVTATFEAVNDGSTEEAAWAELHSMPCFPSVDVTVALADLGWRSFPGGRTATGERTVRAGLLVVLQRSDSKEET